MGGAVARGDEDGSAFNGRAAGHTFNITAMTESAEGFEEEREWARGLWSALAPHHMDTVYVNFLMDEGSERVREAYGDERYERLKQLKRKYDPDEPLQPEPEHRARLSGRGALRRAMTETRDAEPAAGSEGLVLEIERGDGVPDGTGYALNRDLARYGE